MISEEKSYKRVCKENLFDFQNQNVLIVGKPLQLRNGVLQISLGENGKIHKIYKIYKIYKI